MLARGEELGSERDRCVQALAAAQAEAEKVAAELQAIERDGDQYYAEAIERFRGFLGRTEAAALEREALRTPEATDDRLVAEVTKLGAEVAELERRLRELQQEQTAAEGLSAGLRDMERRFLAQNYDSVRSYFEADPLADMDAFARGEIDAADAWARLQRRQRFRSPEPPRDRGDGSGRGFDFDLDLGGAGGLLARAMVEIAGAAMRGAVTRSVRRRSPSWPAGRSSGRASVGRPGGGAGGGRRGGGFTTIDGF
jgi:hypothetical protein